MMIFDYVVFYVPETKVAGGTVITEAPAIVVQGRLLEKDQATAQLKVTRLIPTDYDDKLDRLTIAIKPF